MFWHPTVGDRSSRRLSQRLAKSAELVEEPQRSRIITKLNSTVFISHTSRDADLIGETPTDGRIYSQVCEHFQDPFRHSILTGAPDAYEKIVGLALTSSRWVLVVWTKNAIKSDYVRAEVLLAAEMQKRIAAFCPNRDPEFPVNRAEIAKSCEDLRVILTSWRQEF